RPEARLNHRSDLQTRQRRNPHRRGRRRSSARQRQTQQPGVQAPVASPRAGGAWKEAARPGNDLEESDPVAMRRLAANAVPVVALVLLCASTSLAAHPARPAAGGVTFTRVDGKTEVKYGQSK